MKDFWDLNNDGNLDIGEKSLRDATYLSVLEEDDNETYSPGGSAPIATGLGKVLLFIGILLLLGALIK